MKVKYNIDIVSGHSKWSNIKRKKEANDKQKGNIFGKLSRLITLAVIEGGGITNPENNVKLRLVIDKARVENMPKSNIERAIEKGVGPDKTLISEVVYEGFGPAGIGLMILATTDNSNRTLSEIRNILERNGGKLANKGAVGYLFKKCGVVNFLRTKNSEEKVLQFSEKIQAFDIEEDDSYFTVYLPFEFLGKVKDNLGDLQAEPAEVDYKPTSMIEIVNREKVKKIFNLINSLEELDDVHKIFSNFTVPTALINESLN